VNDVAGSPLSTLREHRSYARGYPITASPAVKIRSYYGLFLNTMQTWCNRTGRAGKGGIVAFDFVKRDPMRDRDAALRNIQRLRRSLETLTTNAAGLSLLSTSMATKFLRRSSRLAAPFPDAYLAGDLLALDDDSKTMLSAYAQDLMQLEQSATTSSLPLAKVTAPGFGIVASSIQAVAHASIMFLHEGRALWQELLRGLPSYGSHYGEILNPDAGDDEIADDLFVPLMLVPDWPARFRFERKADGDARLTDASRLRSPMTKSAVSNPVNAPAQLGKRRGFPTQPLANENRGSELRLHESSGHDSQANMGERTARTTGQDEDKILESIRLALGAPE